MNRLKFAVLSLVFISCATPQPQKIPEIDGRVLSSLELEGLEPREIRVEVVNERQINIDAQNSREIENLVKGQVAQSLNQGGIKLYPTSKNSMTFWLKDCAQAVEGAECLQLESEIKSVEKKKVRTFKFQNKCQDMVQNKVTKNISKGDVSKVYQDCLTLQFKSINQQFKSVSHGANPASP